MPSYYLEIIPVVVIVVVGPYSRLYFLVFLNFVIIDIPPAFHVLGVPATKIFGIASIKKKITIKTPHTGQYTQPLKVLFFFKRHEILSVVKTCRMFHSRSLTLKI